MSSPSSWNGGGAWAARWQQWGDRGSAPREQQAKERSRREWGDARTDDQRLADEQERILGLLAKGGSKGGRAAYPPLRERTKSDTSSDSGSKPKPWALGPEDFALAGCCDGKVQMIGLVSGALHTSLEGHTGCVNAVAVSVDGLHAVTASADSTARLWHLGTGTCERILKGHDDGISSVAFSSRMDAAGLPLHILTGSTDSKAKLWRSSTGECKLTFGDRGFHEILGAAFSDSEDLTAILVTSMGEVSLWRLDTGTFVGVVGMHRKAAVSIAVSPDYWSAMSAGADRLAIIWSLERHAVSEKPPYRSAGSGRKASEGPFYDEEDSADHLELDNHREAVTTAVFSPDGRYALTGCAGAELKVWHADTGRLLTTLYGHAASVNAAVFFQTGAFLATGSADGTVKVWSAETRRCVRSVDVVKGAVTALAVLRRRQDGTARRPAGTAKTGQRVSFADVVKKKGIGSDRASNSTSPPVSPVPPLHASRWSRAARAESSSPVEVVSSSAENSPRITSSPGTPPPQAGTEAAPKDQGSQDDSPRQADEASTASTESPHGEGSLRASSKGSPRTEKVTAPMCSICKSKTADTAVVPCGHLCGCHDCLCALQDVRRAACPKCGGEVEGVLRIFQD